MNYVFLCIFVALETSISYEKAKETQNATANILLRITHIGNSDDVFVEKLQSTGNTVSWSAACQWRRHHRYRH